MHSATSELAGQGKQAHGDRRFEPGHPAPVKQLPACLCVFDFTYFWFASAFLACEMLEVAPQDCVKRPERACQTSSGAFCDPSRVQATGSKWAHTELRTPRVHARAMPTMPMGSPSARTPYSAGERAWSFQRCDSKPLDFTIMLPWPVRHPCTRFFNVQTSKHGQNACGVACVSEQPPWRTCIETKV